MYVPYIFTYLHTHEKNICIGMNIHISHIYIYEYIYICIYIYVCTLEVMAVVYTHKQIRFITYYILLYVVSNI